MTAAKRKAQGERLRQAREAKGLTAGQAAKQIGVLAAEWKQWEAGQRHLPFVEGVHAAVLLGIDLDWLAKG